MFIEQQVAELSKMDTNLSKRIAAIEARLDANERRSAEIIAKISASSGVGRDKLVALLDKLIEVLDTQGCPPAPNGSARDDGEPTNTPPIGQAQKAGALPQSADIEGERSAEVVTLPGVALATPATDLKLRIMQARQVLFLEERDFTGPRGVVRLNGPQSTIIARLLRRPHPIALLAENDTQAAMRMCLMRIAALKGVLEKVGVEIVQHNQNYALAVTSLSDEVA